MIPEYKYDHFAYYMQYVHAFGNAKIKLDDKKFGHTDKNLWKRTK
jgi:hypothetical protein